MTDLKAGQIVLGSRIRGRGRGRDHVVVSSAAEGAGYDVTGLTGWTPIDTLPTGHVAVKIDDLDLNHPEGIRALWKRVQRLTTDPHSHETYEEWAAANNSRCTEVLKPGHVQVRVDDLDLNLWEGAIEDRQHADTYRLAARVAGIVYGPRSSRERVESVTATPAPAPAPVTDSGAPNLTTDNEGPHSRACGIRNHTHGFACAPDCPTCHPHSGDGQPATATVTTTIPCPWCDGSVNMDLRLDRTHKRGVTSHVSADGGHTCPPAQPDEPTAFGAQVTVTRPDGEVEKWLRGDDGSEPWISENTLWWSWEDLCERGVITLGWPQDATDANLPAS